MCFCFLGLSKAAKKKQPRLLGKNLPKLVATDWISLKAAVVGSCVRNTTTFQDLGVILLSFIYVCTYVCTYMYVVRICMCICIYIYVYVCSKIFWKYIMKCIWRGRESELDIFGKNIAIYYHPLDASLRDGPRIV